MFSNHLDLIAAKIPGMLHRYLFSIALSEISITQDDDSSLLKFMVSFLYAIPLLDAPVSTTQMPRHCTVLKYCGSSKPTKIKYVIKMCTISKIYLIHCCYQSCLLVIFRVFFQASIRIHVKSYLSIASMASFSWFLSMIELFFGCSNCQLDRFICFHDINTDNCIEDIVILFQH